MTKNKVLLVVLIILVCLSSIPFISGGGDNTGEGGSGCNNECGDEWSNECSNEWSNEWRGEAANIIVSIVVV